MRQLRDGYLLEERARKMNKKAIMTSPADWFKGLVVGFVIGVVLTYLIAKGIVPILQFLFVPAA
jgi:hypothetical protein